MGLYIDIVRLRHKDEGLDGDDTECCTPSCTCICLHLLTGAQLGQDGFLCFILGPSSHYQHTAVFHLCEVHKTVRRGVGRPGSYEVLAWIQVIIL